MTDDFTFDWGEGIYSFYTVLFYKRQFSVA
jgi:hypothetical protein